MNIQYMIAIAIAVVSLFSGWYVEHLRFETYITKTAQAGDEQKAKTELLNHQQDVITQQIKDDYEKQIADIKSAYSRRVFINPSSGQVSSIPDTTDRVNETTPDQLFTQQCAETTQQLVDLQKWLNEQITLSK